MSVVNKLMEIAVADVGTLHTLDERGDTFDVPRDVTFLMRAPSAKQAGLVANFMNEHHYGEATALEKDGQHSVEVVIHMPIEQHNILCVSGFITCLCTLFDLEYGGWQAEIQKDEDA